MRSLKPWSDGPAFWRSSWIAVFPMFSYGVMIGEFVLPRRYGDPVHLSGSAAYILGGGLWVASLFLLLSTLNYLTRKVLVRSERQPKRLLLFIVFLIALGIALWAWMGEASYGTRLMLSLLSLVATFRVLTEP